MLFPSLLGNTKLDITQVTYAEVGKAFNPKNTRQRVVWTDSQTSERAQLLSVSVSDTSRKKLRYSSNTKIEPVSKRINNRKRWECWVRERERGEEQGRIEKAQLVFWQVFDICQYILSLLRPNRDRTKIILKYFDKVIYLFFLY